VYFPPQKKGNVTRRWWQGRELDYEDKRNPAGII